MRSVLALTRMPQIPLCSVCNLFARNPHLVCAVHPDGPTTDTCLDFRAPLLHEPEPLWEPEGASYYNGELSLFKPRLTREQQLWLLDNHPFFTGRCPQCHYRFDPNHPPQVHWDCPDCGWIDDALH